MLTSDGRGQAMAPWCYRFNLGTFVVSTGAALASCQGRA